MLSCSHVKTKFFFCCGNSGGLVSDLLHFRPLKSLQEVFQCKSKRNDMDDFKVKVVMESFLSFFLDVF